MNKPRLVALVSSLLLACASAPPVRRASADVEPSSSKRVLAPLSAPKSAGWTRAAKEPSDVEEAEEQDFSGQDVAPPADEEEAEPQREVDVSGIEGTMSEFDVRVALDGRDADFNRCHDEHRGGSGRIVFRIHILASGDVGGVKAHPSRVRSKGILECYTRVVSSTHFSAPHGGYADVKWTTKVGRSRKRPDAIYDRPHRFDAAPSSKAQRVSEGRGERRRHHHRHHGSRHKKRG